VIFARRLGVITAALALSLLAVSPALATDINPGQVPTTAAGFPDKDCTGVLNVADGSDGWHFVLNDNPGGTLQTSMQLTAYFNDANGVAQAPIVVGYSSTSDHVVYQFLVTTPDGWTLTGASTSPASNGGHPNLVLSSVCIGGPGTGIPEAPIAMFLPLIALVAFGGYLFKNRRGSTVDA
jgi:hypothetical protein